MYIRENDKAKNVLILPDPLPALHGIDPREKQAERLRMHQVKQVLSFGGMAVAGRVCKGVVGKRMAVCGYIRAQAAI
jgi:hypothetical protein